MYRLYIYAVSFIVLYWFFLLATNGSEKRAVYSDPFNKIVFDMPFLEKCCSWWPLSHFIFFLIIGILFPDCDLPAILGGIAWELTEVGVYYAIGQDRQGTRNGDGKIQYAESWWMGSTQDIVMNIVGFYLGKFLNKILGVNFVCVKEIGECDCKCTKEKNEIVV